MDTAGAPVTRASDPEPTPLTRGAYSALVTDAGAGWSAHGALALTRWRGDRTRESEGLFLYVRDLDSGDRWSGGLQPVPSRPDRYTVRRADDAVEIARMDHDVTLVTTVRLAPEGDAELRRYALTNRGARARRLELTTYAEVVLNSAAADASHPAFSNLFVQTEYDAEHGALLARRRPRSPEDEVLWLAHLLRAGDAGDVEPGYETDRARFIGRGRSLAAPRALDDDAQLSRTTGAVLDPIVSLRRVVVVAPGETVRVTALLGAGADRAAVDAVIARYADARALDAVFAGTPSFGAEVAADDAMASAPRHAPAVGGGERRPDRGGAGDAEPLRFFNGHGGFSDDGTEYVIRLPSTPTGPARPPLPWVNVIANEQLGFLVSEAGAAHTWAANSRENRLTSWYNDPVCDQHAEALYVRDDGSGEFWSPTPGPAPGDGGYETRHGWGYTRFAHESAELRQEVWQFVPRHDPVRIAHVRLTNTGARARRLSVYSYHELVLGDLLASSGRHVVTERDAASGALFAVNRARGEFSERVAFAAVAGPGAVHVTGDRTAFLGRYGSAASPAAIASEETLDDRTGADLDPCAALQLSLELAPGASADVVFLLGEAADAETARAVVERYRDAAAAERALHEVRAFWRDLVGGVRVETPEPAIDLLVNGWLAYQNLSCRMWARSAFYQSGGAFGFRDQLQDSAALVYLDPAVTRRQIVLNAAHQFVEGDVLHWWHPPTSKGIRTRFADDLLWLPYITAFYVRATGDASVLHEHARFVTARELEPGEDEAFLFPQDAGTRADVYEHCCMAIDRSLTRGAHGLPLMGTGDWNDGMNRVGREGRGESVWLGFFLHTILDEFLPLVDARGDEERATRYRDYRAALGAALNDGGWDGAWYRRAYYDDGTPLGSADGDECRIDAIAQAWAVISGVAPPHRAARALDALEAQLVDETAGIIRLLTPPFDRTPHDPGYIKGYLPGVRENGGQYTHGALWAVRALAEAGRTERAAPLLAMLSPVSHAASPERTATYRAEPYVIAADVYGVAPHVGRGGWTWYTGSAGWYYRVALESVLGVELVEGRSLALRARIPRAWPGFTLRYRLPDGRTVYEIDVRRGDGAAAGDMDGRPLAVDGDRVLVPLAGDGLTHRVRVTIASSAEG